MIRPVIFVAALATGAGAAPVRIGPGQVAARSVAVFRLDVEPVTNAEFRAFVLAHPRWRRDRVEPLFADADYLSHWTGATTLGARAPARAPVVRVSWCAARASCAARRPATDRGRVGARGRRERDPARRLR